MPSLYTHQILAEKVMELLPERTRRYVTREGEYFLGAQGGDVFYLYKMREGQKNLGKYLHRKNVYMVFCNFLEAARSGDGCVTSYIAGYITHYAGDIVFHPYVYSLLNRLEFEDTGNWKGNRHALIESDMDSYFVRKYKDLTPHEYKYPLSYSDISCESLFRLMEDSTGERTKRNVRMHAFKTAVKRFIRYNRWLHDGTGGKKKFVYGTEKLFHIPHTLSSLIHRADYDESYFNLERAPWRYPNDDSLVFTDGRGRTVRPRRVRERTPDHPLFDCLENGTPLEYNDFSKHFLTGLVIGG